MRSYLIDEISPSHMEKIMTFLKENSAASHLEGLFWVHIPEDLLDRTQFQHRTCRPHAFAVEVGENWVKLEFLIRSLNNMNCVCQGYGSKQQIDFIIRYAHNLIKHLGVKT